MSQPLLGTLLDAELAEQGQNSLFLKEQALTLVQQVCEQNWTDHNTADPGITLLEVLSFAISDLCYRLDFPVADLLAKNKEKAEWEPQAFYLAPDILPSNMVTNRDIRQAILDVKGVKNVAVVPGSYRSSTTASTESEHFAIASVKLLLELEPEWAYLPLELQTPVLDAVRHTFLQERNVNQDLSEIQVLAPKNIGVRLVMDLDGASDPIANVAEVFKACAKKIAPDIHRYTLQEMQHQGLSGDAIFNGPLAKNGYRSQTELLDVQLPEWVFSSDVLEVLDGKNGLNSISGFSFITGEVGSGADSDEQSYWRMRLQAGEVAVFDLDLSLSQLVLSIDGQTMTLDATDQQRIAELVRQNNEVMSLLIAPHIDDFIGARYRQLNQFISIQTEFPEVYRLSEKRIDGDIASPELGQILQLKGFLTLFDQILADETAQLDNLRKLLAIPDTEVYPRLMYVFNKMLASEALTSQDIKQFWQDIRALPHSQLSQAITGVSGIKHLLSDYFDTYQAQGFQSQAEPIFSQTQLTRLISSLDHLLARFAERRLDAGVLKYRSVFSHYLGAFYPIPNDISQDQPLLEKLVQLKSLLDLAATIKDYPMISRYRSGGMNYLSLNPQRAHSGGLLKRLGRFLGWSHLGQMPLAITNRESGYLLESELLRFGTNAQSYRANELYFVLPNWPSRFANAEYQSLLAEQIRQQSPVHQTVYLITLSRELMSLFERLYFSWLNAMTQKSLPVSRSSVGQNEALALPHSAHENQLIDLLSGYLRDFVETPETLLQQVLTTLNQEREKAGEQPWQELLLRINTWLGEAESAPVVGNDYASICESLAQYLTQADGVLSHLSVDSVLFSIAHEHLDAMFNPHPISNASVGVDFRIGYQPLDYLKPSYPISAAYLHPGHEGMPNFTVRINDPHFI
ncbi:hypothetical protein [Alteromonas sp. a30]|uniref:hypothetical protein n=1 Tax=Alteromonas sp. a30 TaxID=2730917 RepID=UPI00228071BA|nr:hypothetical protein [Alteromonas sp. a30]MCY7296523.1 hypothetical protein [Alteromonas sp. a30]